MAKSGGKILPNSGQGKGGKEMAGGGKGGSCIGTPKKGGKSK